MQLKASGELEVKLAEMRSRSDDLVALLGRQAAGRPAIRRAATASARWIGKREHRILGGDAAGYRIRLEHTVKLGYVLGSSERPLQTFLAHELDPGGVFYDLGANIGFLTMVGARAVGPGGQVVAFEPSPGNAATLSRNVTLNRLSWVEVVQAAVGAASGMAYFAAGDSDQTGHLAAETTESGAMVSMISLDDWLSSGHRPPDVLKIDVEGAERDVLHGALRLLSVHRPVVVCEIHDVGPRLDDHVVSRFLRGLGYSTQWLDPVAGKIADYWAPHLVARPEH